MRLLMVRGPLAMLVVVAACSGAAARPTSTPTNPASLGRYEVVLEVAYAEHLRIPGTGYVLRDLRLDYAIETELEPELVHEPPVTGHAEWTVRCYLDPFSPGHEPAVVFTGIHPPIVEWSRDQIRGSADLEPEVDWEAGPTLLLHLRGDVLQVVHRVPAALALDEPIGCEGEEGYSALALGFGHGAMTAPGRVVTAAGSTSRAEAINASGGSAAYHVGDGAGWIVAEVDVAGIGDRPSLIDFRFVAGPEPEGGERLAVVGGIRRLSG